MNDNKIKKEKIKIQNPIINTNVMDENVFSNLKKIEQPSNIPLTQNIPQSNTIFNQNIPFQEPLNNTINTPIVPVTQNALPAAQVKIPKLKKLTENYKIRKNKK